MATIWKELLFLHGHFVRASDLREDTATAAPDVPAPLRQSAPATQETPALLAGGCS